MSIRLGCYIIVKGDSDKIMSCIDSQIGLGDAIVVAVDAGNDSNDTFAKLAAIDSPSFYVYRQVWPDSFSDARNEALDVLLQREPDLDYVYWVDSDDVWDPSINFSVLRSKLEEERPRSVSLEYQYTDNLKFYRNRIWRVDNGKSACRWVGSAHEVEKLEDGFEGIEVWWPGFRLVHTRGDNDKAVDETGKREKNIKLLEKDIELHPENVRSWYYLGQEYKDNRDYPKAIMTFLSYLEKSDNIAEKYQALLNLMNIYLDIKVYSEARRYGLKAVELYPKVAFAPTLLGDICRLQENWEEAAVWYQYAVEAPGAPVIFDFEDIRTIVPLRWLSVACSRLGRHEEAAMYHCKAGECQLQDGLQKHNDVWLFSNKYVPKFVKPHFDATAVFIDPNDYMVIENFNENQVKSDIQAMMAYNKEMELVRILNEGTPEAAAVLFKGYMDFKHTTPAEEKQKIADVPYTELFHPTQLSAYEKFYETMTLKALRRADYKDKFVLVELGSDIGLSARLFLKLLKGIRDISATFVDTNYAKELWAIIDDTRSFFIQDTAQNAAKTFADESIDLLHMDLAPHSYEQAVEIFKLYLPKMKKNGVWIWHDCGRARDFNFGGRRFLDELRSPWCISYCKEDDRLPDVAPAAIWKEEY